MLGEVIEREKARRRERSLTAWSNLILKLGKTTIHKLFLFLSHRATSKQGRCQEERALGGIDSSAFSLSLLMDALIIVMQGSEFTAVDAIAANYTARVIDSMRLVIYACRLAILRTKGAVLTFLLVEADLQERESC